MTERRVLIRLMVGLNVGLFAGYIGHIVLALGSGANPWAGMAMFWLVPVAALVFIVLVPLAAIGLSAPLAMFDLAADRYLLMARTPIGIVLAACAAIAFAAGMTHQGVVMLNWLSGRSKTDDSWTTEGPEPR